MSNRKKNGKQEEKNGDDDGGKVKLIYNFSRKEEDGPGIIRKIKLLLTESNEQLRMIDDDESRDELLSIQGRIRQVR